MPTMPIPSATNVGPYWAVVANKPVCTTGRVYGVSLVWTNPGIPSGHGFVAWVIQRSDDNTGYYEIARIASAAQLTFVDYEARRNVLCSYRVLLETDYGISAPSTVRTATPPGCCGYTFTSNAQPDLNLARDDVDDRDVEWPNDNTEEWALYGRNNVVVFRGTEDPGDEFRIQVLLWTSNTSTTTNPPAMTGFPTIGAGAQAWEPVRRLVRSQTPYVCVLDEVGSRWYASISTNGGGSYTNVAQSWIASLRVREVSDVPYAVAQ